MLILAPAVSAIGEVYDGNTVYINDSEVYFSATPHTKTSNGWITYNLIEKNYTGLKHIAIGLSNIITTPTSPQRYDNSIINTDNNFTCIDSLAYNSSTKNFTCYQTGGVVFAHDYETINATSGYITYNHTGPAGWYNMNNTYNNISYMYDDKNKWYIIQDINFTQDEPVELRVWFTIPRLAIGEYVEDVFPGFEGKYDLLSFPSSYPATINGLNDSINANDFNLLDPHLNITNGLVLSYSFDTVDLTGGNPDDLSGNGYNGIRTGASSNLSGFINESFSFDGTGDFVNTTFEFTGESYTVNYWMKTTPHSTHDVVWCAQRAPRICYNLANNDPTFKYGNMNMLGISLKTLTDTQNGSWIMMTHRNSDTFPGVLSTWINGVQHVAQGNSGNLWSNTEQVTIGRDIGIAPRDYEGNLDEFSIWNRHLSDEEILLLYNEGEGLAYPFDLPPENSAPVLNTVSLSSTLTELMLSTNISDNDNQSTVTAEYNLFEDMTSVTSGTINVTNGIDDNFLNYTASVANYTLMVRGTDGINTTAYVNSTDFSFTFCAPDYVCSGYDNATCYNNDTSQQACNAVTDNNLCGDTYMGDFSEFSPIVGVCDFCIPDFAPTCTVYNTSACNGNPGGNYSCAATIDNNNCFAQTSLPSDEPDLLGLYGEFQCTELANTGFANLKTLLFSLLPLLLILGLIFTVPNIRSFVIDKISDTTNAQKMVGIAIAMIIIIALIKLL